MLLHTEIAQRAQSLKNKLTTLRRTFYTYPELSGEESATAQRIAAQLQDLGLHVQTNVGGHGVVGILTGRQPGGVVAYRADMDALPIQDTLDKAYRSAARGIKHACGHDAHLAIALGAAEILTARREQVHGSVKFIFQPAEESLAGGQAMIAAGVLEAPTPGAIFALHTFPIPVGQVGLSKGLALAGMDEYRVRLYSPAGQLPQLAEHAAAALRILSTADAPTDYATFQAVVHAMQTGAQQHHTIFVSCWLGTAPDAPHLLCLVSVPHPALRVHVEDQIRATLRNVTDAVGGSFDLIPTFHNPPVINDAALCAAVQPALEGVVGAGNVLRFQSPYPFAHEDFALYQQRVPGLFIWLGTANPEKGLTSILHQADFDIDEDALVIGTELTATLLTTYLRSVVT